MPGIRPSTDPQQPAPRSRRSALLLLCLSLACKGGSVDEAAALAGGAADGADKAWGANAAEVLAVTGGSGLRSAGLAEGTYLGKGAKLGAGQSVETPAGTLAEIAVGDARVRVNERTSFAVAAGDAPRVDLESGELVVVRDGDRSSDSWLVVAAGDDSLRVQDGEALVRRTSDARHFAVVRGHAVLETGGKSLELGPGQSMTTPLPVEKPEVRPELSLRALEDTGWSRTFENASAMVASVPRGVGSLTARVPGSQTEQQKLRLVDQKVTVAISGRIAHTEIEQAFFNDRPAVLEGIYRFPLPGDGSISGLQLLVGNTWMEGEVVEKQRARQIFQQIVDATIPRDPALLEWERGNVFKLRVFPIPGRGERRIRLQYTQLLPVVGDSVRYRFPLGGTGATGTTIDHFEFSVSLDKSEIDPAKLEQIETPMLALERRDSGDKIELHAERERFEPTFDLGVDIPIANAAHPVHASSHLDKDGQAYFMLALRPELELAPDQRPVHYAFVLDRSHSTTPELWTLARGLVEALAGAMEDDDRFTVLACDSACDEIAGGLQAPSKASLDDAQRFLDGQDLAGASDVGGMMIEASEALDRGGEPAATRRVIVYMGDGTPSSGELAVDKLVGLVRDPLRDVRVQAIALGARSDLTTLDALVEATGGDLVQADVRDDMDALVRELRLRTEVPVARNVEIEVLPGMVSVHHEAASGIRPGETVFVTGKLSQPVRGAVKLRAAGPDGKAVEQSFEVDLSAEREGTLVTSRHLPRTWAQMEIAELTRTAGFGARERIVAMSKDYTVLSRFTALLVLENDAMYREFNVVRTADTTDKWRGALPEGEKAPESRAEITTTPTTPSPDPAQPNAASEHAKNEEVDGGLGLSGTGRGGGGAGEPFGDIGTKGGGGFAQPPPADNKSDADKEFGFDPPAAAEPSKDAPREIEEKSRDDDASDPLAGFEDEGGGGAPSGGSKSAPAKKAKAPSSAPKPSSLDPGDSGLGKGGWGGPPSWHGFVAPRLRIQQIAASDAGAIAKVEGLRRGVAAAPGSRAAHGKMVRAAIRAGHPDALVFARAWAEVDPDHGPALTALADALARTGDPLAPRAYASVLEVTPFSRGEHEALAAAFASKGDLDRACSHRRAIVSIDPSDGDHHAGLVACLARAGRMTEARAAASDGRGRASKDFDSLAVIARDVDRGVAPPKPRAPKGGELRATLTWSGEDDLDIVVIDAQGRRLSALHPTKLRAFEGNGLEEITMPKVKKSVFVEITRAGLPEGARPGPVRAVLELKTPHGRKRIDVVIDQGTNRVARIFWS